MKKQHRANINALLSASVWGLAINLIVRNSIGFVNGIFHKILWDSGTFLGLMLYPALLSTILHKKTNLWLSVFFFSATGSALSIWLLFAFDSFQQKAWLTIGALVLIVWLFSQKAIPTLEGHPTVQKEWESPLWERMNDFSLIEFLFLRFDFTDYIPAAKPNTVEKKIDAPDKEKNSQESVCPACGQSTSPKLFPAKTSERIKTAIVLFLLIYMVASIFLCMLSVPPGLTKHPTWSQPAYAAWLQPLSKTPAFQIIVGSGFVIGFLAFSWDGVQIILGNLRKRRGHFPEKDNSVYKYKCRHCGHQWN